MLAVQVPVLLSQVPELTQLKKEDPRRQQDRADHWLDGNALALVTIPGLSTTRGSGMVRGPVGPLWVWVRPMSMWLWVRRCFLVFFNPVVKVGDPGEDTGAGEWGFTRCAPAGQPHQVPGAIQ